MVLPVVAELHLPKIVKKLIRLAWLGNMNSHAHHISNLILFAVPLSLPPGLTKKHSLEIGDAAWYYKTLKVSHMMFHEFKKSKDV